MTEFDFYKKGTTSEIFYAVNNKHKRISLTIGSVFYFSWGSNSRKKCLVSNPDLGVETCKFDHKQHFGFHV